MDGRRPRWTPREDAVIIRYFDVIGVQALCERLQRSEDAVHRRRLKLCGYRTLKHEWTDEQRAYVFAHYKVDMNTREIAAHLNAMYGLAITKNAVIAQARDQGLCEEGGQHAAARMLWIQRRRKHGL